MNRRLLFVVGSTLLIAASMITRGMADGTQPDDAVEHTIRPYFAVRGPHSAINYQAFVVIRDQETMSDMWKKHKGDAIERAGQGWPLTPEVDFETCMVIALFRGQSVNCSGEAFVSMIEEDDHVRIRYDSVTYQTASFDGEDHGDSVTPYGIFVVPRVDKVVRLEKNTQGLIGRPPVWTQQAVISFPHGKRGWYVPGAFGAAEKRGP